MVMDNYKDYQFCMDLRTNSWSSFLEAYFKATMRKHPEEEREEDRKFARKKTIRRTRWRNLPRLRLGVSPNPGSAGRKLRKFLLSPRFRPRSSPPGK